MTERAALACVDTGVLTAALRPGSELDHRYRRHLVGRTLVISTQVVAEARYGAFRAGWGTRRIVQLERLLHRAIAIVPNDSLATEYARLKVACEQVGHALHQKVHAGDLWIAATALHRGLPLITDDSVFENCPGLAVIRERS
jgi:predicted nucleic acid-binding protein